MNTSTFLALKIAEAAGEVAAQAESVADCHPALALFERDELANNLLALYAIVGVAVSNGVLPKGTTEGCERITSDTRRALAREALTDMVQGKLTGDLVV